MPRNRGGGGARDHCLGIPPIPFQSIGRGRESGGEAKLRSMEAEQR